MPATDMLYPMIAVPGRVNGGLHEILTVDEFINSSDNLFTGNKAPKSHIIRHFYLFSSATEYYIHIL